MKLCLPQDVRRVGKSDYLGFPYRFVYDPTPDEDENYVAYGLRFKGPWMIVSQYTEPEGPYTFDVARVLVRMHNAQVEKR